MTETTGDLNVGIVSGVTVSKWARVWNERYTDEVLRIVPVDQAAQAEALHAGGLTMCFVRLPIDRTGLNVIPLYTEAPYAMVPKDSDLAKLDVLSVADLIGQVLLHDPLSVVEWRGALAALPESEAPVPPTADVDAAVELLAAGIGVLIVPQSVSRLYNRKDVVSRPIDLPDTSIALAWPVEVDHPMIEDFIGIVRGRSANSSRAAMSEEVAKAEKAARAKARSDKARAASAKSSAQRDARISARKAVARKGGGKRTGKGSRRG